MRAAYARDPAAHKARSRRNYVKNPKVYLERCRFRQVSKKQRTPAWADRQAIREVYAGCPPGFHVDHEIPLHGKLVSGLHVAENLQYLPAVENRQKSNHF